MPLIRLFAISLFLQQVVKLPEEAEEDETTTEVSSPSSGDTVEELETKGMAVDVEGTVQKDSVGVDAEVIRIAISLLEVLLMCLFMCWCFPCRSRPTHASGRPS